MKRSSQRGLGIHSRRSRGGWGSRGLDGRGSGRCFHSLRFQGLELGSPEGCLGYMILLQREQRWFGQAMVRRQSGSDLELIKIVFEDGDVEAYQRMHCCLCRSNRVSSLLQLSHVIRELEGMDLFEASLVLTFILRNRQGIQSQSSIY